MGPAAEAAADDILDDVLADLPAPPAAAPAAAAATNSTAPPAPVDTILAQWQTAVDSPSILAQWQTAVDSLTAMGFEPAKFQSLLHENKGNIQKIMDELLE